MHLSVVICTYNRAGSIGQCLAAFERVSIPSGLHWELMVVDNNSTDHTRRIVAEFQGRNKIPITYVFERERGKCHALNTGLKHCAGEIIAITDDDCIVSDNWIEAVYQEFFGDKLLEGLGGKVDLYDPRDWPVTIRPFKERIPFKSTAQVFYLIAGCNMAFRRHVFEEIGGFDPDFGSVSGLVADDTDFIYRAFKHGFKIVYSPDVLVYHNHGRRTEEQVRTLNRSYIRGRGGFYCKHILHGDIQVVRMAYWETRSLLKDAFKKLVQMRWPYEEAWVLANLGIGSTREVMNKVSFQALKAASRSPAA